MEVTQCLALRLAIAVLVYQSACDAWSLKQVTGFEGKAVGRVKIPRILSVGLTICK